MSGSVRARLRQLADDLTGSAGRRGMQHLLDQADAAERAALVALEMVQGSIRPADARAELGSIEHASDHHRALLVQSLRQSLTTTIDREDLYRLSRSLDDVVDNLRDFVRESDLYRANSQLSDAPLLEAVAAGVRELTLAIQLLIDEPFEVFRHALATRKQANQVRTHYQHTLADLFQQPLDMEVLKRRELLRRLDVVALRMSEAADVINDGVLKRSH